jgi:hypothetical protein
VPVTEPSDVFNAGLARQSDGRRLGRRVSLRLQLVLRSVVGWSLDT